MLRSSRRVGDRLVWVGYALIAVWLLSFALAIEADGYATPPALVEGAPLVCSPRPAEYGGTDETQARLVEAEQARSDACVRAEQWQRYVAAERLLAVKHETGQTDEIGWMVTGGVAGLLFFTFALNKVLLP